MEALETFHERVEDWPAVILVEDAVKELITGAVLAGDPPPPPVLLPVLPAFVEVSTHWAAVGVTVTTSAPLELGLMVKVATPLLQVMLSVLLLPLAVKSREAEVTIKDPEAGTVTTKLSALTTRVVAAERATIVRLMAGEVKAIVAFGV